jgi:hypothetical protein
MAPAKLMSGLAPTVVGQAESSRALAAPEPIVGRSTVVRLSRLEHHLEKREPAARNSIKPALERGRNVGWLCHAIANAAVSARKQRILG